jgi:hypothetical protein
MGGIMSRKHFNPDVIDLTFNMADGSVVIRYPDDEFSYPLNAFDNDGDEAFEQVRYAVRDHLLSQTAV